MAYSLGDFSLDLRKSVTPPNHIWVNSGYGTCSPIPSTTAGVRGFFSPPFAAQSVALAIIIEANGHTVADNANLNDEDCGLLFAGAEWRPDRLIRKGTYHFFVNGELLSFAVTTDLSPLFGRAGFILKVKIRNRSKNALNLNVQPIVKPGRPSVAPLSGWGFNAPQESAGEAVQKHSNIWENEEVRITLRESLSQFTLNNSEDCVCQFALVFTKTGIAADNPADLEDWQEETTKAWEKRIDLCNQKLPTLRSDIPGLEQYYKRSVISGLVCLWENDGFLFSPFFSTCGMDGGAVCCYLWDTGYIAQILTLMQGAKIFGLIRHLLDAGIDKNYALTPDGNGIGVRYAYSMWALINLYWAAANQCRDNIAVFSEIKDLFFKEEASLAEWEHLKNYGNQHNLLEMRASGYEYFVPSPNAERAQCYDRLADIAERTGMADTAPWREKARAIRQSIRKNLWDDRAGWFKCVHPNGHVETIYSIQAYDALRAGCCDEHMKAALLSQLKDGAFLGRYGVSSVSALDEAHYELNDPDWSGGGSYTGDGPILAQTLWEAGSPDLAWDVLKRHFWMGEMLVYYPQEHYCDRPALPAHKRANEISGMAGAQAVLFGMAGIHPAFGGKLIVNPHPPADGFVEITGFVYGGATVDLFMKPGYVRVIVNNYITYEGSPREIEISLP